ncbi:MAG: hypothetical protein WCK00_02775 [Deltaproteobacteria bacterium]
MQIDNHILTVGTHTEELPHLHRVAIVAVWQVPTEYSATGYFVATNRFGEPETIPACAAADAVLLGRLELPAHPEAQLIAAKQDRLTAINSACDAVLSAIVQTYPAGEISSWAQQVKEAEALATNPDADAPLLTAIAAARGITVSELAGKVITKAGAYAVAAGQTIGKRQALETAIEAAETAEAVSVVTW